MSRIFLGFLPYITLIFFLSILSILVNFYIPKDLSYFHEPDFQLFVIGSMIFIGYYVNRVAPKTVIPSFVWAIFAGIALQPFLVFFTKDVSFLKVIMEVFGAIILFAGGLEIPFRSFKKWFFPIVTLSLIGVILSAVGFAFVIYFFMNIFGEFNALFIPSILILSAALSSTDPTAIIPTLKALHFKKKELKQIAISESALTDVSGSIITRFLLLALISVPVTSTSIIPYFLPLLQKNTYDAFALQIISGILIGFLGFLIIKKFYYSNNDEEADPALILSVPIFTFVLGNFLGGAGFLAAFLSGLFTDVIQGVKKNSHFLDSMLNHLIKPFIFIILGALVPINTLIELAPLGILSAFIFMFILRPLVVFISLFPWWYQGLFTIRDLLFLSFVRETGIIAAILLVIAATFNIIQSDFIIAIGMWVILLTLIIEPPLTPFIARKIGVLKDK